MIQTTKSVQPLAKRFPSSTMKLPSITYQKTSCIRSLVVFWIKRSLLLLPLLLSLAAHLPRRPSALRPFTVSLNSITLLTLKCSSPFFLVCLSSPHVSCSENNDAAAITHFAWIPDSMLQVVGQSALVRYMIPLHYGNPNTVSTETSSTVCGQRSFFHSPTTHFCGPKSC